jgi:hypothetical protein
MAGGGRSKTLAFPTAAAGASESRCGRCTANVVDNAVAAAG